MSRGNRRLAFAVALALSSSPLIGQAAQMPLPPEEDPSVGGSFGLKPQEIFVPAFAFQPDDPGSSWRRDHFSYYQAINGVEALAPLMLPAGARIASIICYFYDNELDADAVVSLMRFNYSTPTQTPSEVVVQPTIVSGAFPGYHTASGLFNETVRYRPTTFTQRFYGLHLAIPDDASNLRFRGCIVNWQRQVSAAPATATFTDVPVSHPFHRFVEALVDAGITSGCGGGLYCVNSPITRGEMAVFLAAALGLHFPN